MRRICQFEGRLTLRLSSVLITLFYLLIPLAASADIIIISVDTFTSVEGYASSEYTSNPPTGAPEYTESGYDDFSLTSPTYCTDFASVELPSIGFVSAFSEGEASADATVTASAISALLDARAEGEAYGFFEEFESLNSDSSVISEAHAIVTFQLTTPYYFDFTADLGYLNYGPASLYVWLDQGSDRLFGYFEGNYAVSGLLDPGIYTLGGHAEFVHAYSINLLNRSVHAQVEYDLLLTPVPEPSTLAMLSSGVLLFLVRRCRAWSIRSA